LNIHKGKKVKLKKYLLETSRNLHERFSYTDTGIYLRALRKETNRQLDNQGINNPVARSLLSLPIGIYLDVQETFGRFLERIELIGEKLFEYPPSYYEREMKEIFGDDR
jgi:hypothetical protein